MSAYPITSSYELHQLIPYVPVMLNWLREVNPATAADVFLRVNKPQVGKQDLIVNFAFQGLLQEIFKSDSDLTITQIKIIFSSYEVQIWSQCLWRLLTNAEPKLLSESLVLILLKTARKQKSDSSDSLAEELMTLLGRLPYKSFIALGELCAFVRDTSVDSRQTATELGPRIILTSNDNPKYYSTASYLFETMVENCEILFDIDITKRANNYQPFGFRRGDSTYNGSLIVFDAQKVLRKQHLKTFYAIRDKKYIPIVDTLFELHGFADIAYGIYRKYRMLPDGWRYELKHMKYQQNLQLDWFDEKNILFLTEEPMNMPPVARRARYYPSKNEEKVEAIVDEIINNEVDYYDKLHDFIHFYVGEITSIARGEITEEAKEALGLTQKQVEEVFGGNLRRCLDLSEKLLVKFEVLTLVRTPIMTTPMGRPGIVADVFLETSEDFVQALGPYNKYHAANTKTMAQAESRLRKGRKTERPRLNFTLGSSSRAPKELNYLEIWAEIQKSRSIFKGREIDGFLIEPVRRCPNYIMFLDRLKKKVGEGHVAYEKLERATNMVNAATQGINQEIKKHERVQEIFGDQFLTKY